MRRVIHAFVLTAIFSGGAFAQTPAAITVTSPTLKANEVVPIDHTADGKNLSPALAWSGAPATTKQFALIYDDPDVAFGNSPQSFVTRCSLKPKNQSTLVLPRRAHPAKTLCEWMRRL